jgi:hypothetical protein
MVSRNAAMVGEFLTAPAGQVIVFDDGRSSQRTPPDYLPARNARDRHRRPLQHRPEDHEPSPAPARSWAISRGLTGSCTASWWSTPAKDWTNRTGDMDAPRDIRGAEAATRRHAKAPLSDQTPARRLICAGVDHRARRAAPREHGRQAARSKRDRPERAREWRGPTQYVRAARGRRARFLFRGLFGNIGWGTECAQGTGTIGGRLPAMSTCSPYAGALLRAGCCEPHQGQTADIDHRAD